MNRSRDKSREVCSPIRESLSPCALGASSWTPRTSWRTRLPYERSALDALERKMQLKEERDELSLDYYLPIFTTPIAACLRRVHESRKRVSPRPPRPATSRSVSPAIKNLIRSMRLSGSSRRAFATRASSSALDDETAGERVDARRALEKDFDTSALSPKRLDARRRSSMGSRTLKTMRASSRLANADHSRAALVDAPPTGLSRCEERDSPRVVQRDCDAPLPRKDSYVSEVHFLLMASNRNCRMEMALRKRLRAGTTSNDFA